MALRVSRSGWIFGSKLQDGSELVRLDRPLPMDWSLIKCKGCAEDWHMLSVPTRSVQHTGSTR